LKETEGSCSIDLSNQDIMYKNKLNSSLKHRPNRRLYGVSSKKIPNHVGIYNKPKLKVRYQNEQIDEDQFDQNEIDEDWLRMNHKSTNINRQYYYNKHHHHHHHHYHHNRKNTYKQQHQQQKKQQQQQKRIWSSLRFKAKEIGKIIPSVRDINIIDKYSRLLFPSLFLLFNICYWCFYFVQSSNYINNNNLN
jgi:hypothetical protein